MACIYVYKLNLGGQNNYFGAARATSGCIVGRIARIGPAHRAAARRRELTRREQERLERDMEAHWRVNVVGRGLMRGRFAV